MVHRYVLDPKSSEPNRYFHRKSDLGSAIHILVLLRKKKISISVNETYLKKIKGKTLCTS